MPIIAPRTPRQLRHLAIAAALFSTVSATALAQPADSLRDPGPRGGQADSGGPLPGLGEHEIAFFRGALAQFTTVDSVTGAIPNETGSGLGPRFNGNVCAACHAYPATGGSSPPSNPQVGLATLDGATNALPSFVTPAGPVREARFKHYPDGSPDGQVHPLFVITNRVDAAQCDIHQPNFRREMAAGNVGLRIPTGLFGLGLVENISEDTLQAAQRAHAVGKAELGISGHFNHDANDGSISRFGWKAQDKSLLTFAGEAYNVEQGVSNELFPNELAGGAKCQFNAQPEDSTFFRNTIHSGSPSSDLASATTNFAVFIRLLAPSQPASPTPAALRGQRLFREAGCESCHFENFVTASSVYTGQSNVVLHPYSDFALHRMGRGLADGIVQGEARGDEFRTAPLWGIGQRLFFLHDGRAGDLVTAIAAHASPASEANASVARFYALAPQQEQDIIDFLRSL
jgi:CxxC motif-containing protein (DUF1111 family)